MDLDAAAVDAAIAEEQFTGVFTIDIDDRRTLERVEGFRHRGYGVPMTADAQIAIASGSKVFTALAVLRLVEDGLLALDAPVRGILGDDLPLIDDAVTIEQLLGHTSGIGDYLDEEGDWDVEDYVMSVPTHTLTTAEAFLPALDGFPQKSAPGERFQYCNGGYAVLGIVLERVVGEPFQEVIRRLVLDPAGLEHTGFLPLNDLPGTAATGYVRNDGDLANTLHLPVLGAPDGGAFTTADDLHRFWQQFLAGAIVSPATVEAMITPRHYDEGEGMHYGLGVWLPLEGRTLAIEGYDAGASFRSTHLPQTRTTVTVLGNSSEGAWPLIGLAADAIEADLAG